MPTIKVPGTKENAAPIRLIPVISAARDRVVIESHLEHWIGEDSFRRSTMSFSDGVLTLMPAYEEGYDFIMDLKGIDGKEVQFIPAPKERADNTLHLLIGRVPGHHDLYLADRRLSQGQDRWTADLRVAEKFPDRESCLSYLDHIRRSMEHYRGIDDATKKPLPKINVPLGVFNLLGLSAENPKATGTIFACEVAFSPMDFLEVEAEFPVKKD
jgi:hypothetical protein